MTVIATKFTPEVLLSAPRRSSAVPNPAGTLALYTVSQYSFDTHSRSHALRLLDIGTSQSTTLYENPAFSEPTWISDAEFLLIRSDSKSTSLLLADATTPGAEPFELATFNGLISNIKVKDIGDGSVAFACTAPTTPAGHMYDPATEPKPQSSARVYTRLFVRHWDAYVGPNTNAVWYGALKRESASGDDRGPFKSARYTLQEPGLVNALRGTGLECPVPNFGDASDYDIARSGLVFVSKDPDLNPALWTKSDLYYVPLRSFSEPSPPRPQLVKTGKLRGYTGSPVFSHDGSSVVFKRMRHAQYESDKWRLMILPDVSDLSNVQEFFKSDDGEGAWDLRPEVIVWSHDDRQLYVTAEKEARTHLFTLPSTPLAATDLPYPLTTGNDSIADFFNLSSNSDKLFLNTSSLIDSKAYAVLDPDSKSTTLLSSASKGGRAFGLSPKQIEDFWFRGAGDYKCHALVVKPSNFDPSSSKRYPLAMLIHGGPQGAWGHSWSTRWNPAIFAEQGYVVVMPNPTGSTGYGQALTDAIAGDWGGRPYNDLVNCFEHIAENLSYVDTSNSVALGASYGGYMINWIQGHPLGRKFRALVCHDGIFSTLSDWSTEELFFPIHDMGGTVWDAREAYARWDPSARVGHWATPQLVIHSELDYRLPISEGLAAFNALQTRSVDSRLLMFPDENHWVLKPENSLVWHKEVLGWINKYVGLDMSGLHEDTERLRIN